MLTQPCGGSHHCRRGGSEAMCCSALGFPCRSQAHRSRCCADRPPDRTNPEQTSEWRIALNAQPSTPDKEIIKSKKNHCDKQDQFQNKKKQSMKPVKHAWMAGKKKKKKLSKHTLTQMKQWLLNIPVAEQHKGPTGFYWGLCSSDPEFCSHLDGPVWWDQREECWRRTGRGNHSFKMYLK